MVVSDTHGGSIDAFVGADPAAGRQLRRALDVLADEHDGTPLGDRLRAVLDGRLTMRELAADPEVAGLARRGMEDFRTAWAELSPGEQRAEVDRVSDLAAAESREA